MLNVNSCKNTLTIPNSQNPNTNIINLLILLGLDGSLDLILIYIQLSKNPHNQYIKEDIIQDLNCTTR